MTRRYAEAVAAAREFQQACNDAHRAGLARMRRAVADALTDARVAAVQPDPPSHGYPPNP